MPSLVRFSSRLIADPTVGHIARARPAPMFMGCGHTRLPVMCNRNAFSSRSMAGDRCGRESPSCGHSSAIGAHGQRTFDGCRYVNVDAMPVGLCLQYDGELFGHLPSDD